MCIPWSHFKGKTYILIVSIGDTKPNEIRLSTKMPYSHSSELRNDGRNVSFKYDTSLRLCKTVAVYLKTASSFIPTRLWDTRYGI
jgi:hypothetical protein